jgi:hypothetical protein
MFYTGARLRANPQCGPPNPPEYDNQLEMFETQLCAVADPGEAAGGGGALGLLGTGHGLLSLLPVDTRWVAFHMHRVYKRQRVLHSYDV